MTSFLFPGYVLSFFCILTIGISSPPLITIIQVSIGNETLATSERRKGNEMIHIWYGNDQRFGHLGQPQRWVNVLGNLVDTTSIQELVFSLNGGEEKHLSLGSDLHRLASPGDFNVELSWDDLSTGKNLLLIKAGYHNGITFERQVMVQVQKGNTWPLPYEIDFSTANDIQDVVQIVDGHWKLEKGGIRTVNHYYDRVLSMGDTSWKNYESQILLTIHDFTPSQPGPPTYNVTHFGVAMRWRGHHEDGRQPSRKWYPLGAQGEFLLKTPLDSCRWRILFDGNAKDKPVKYTENRNTLMLGKPVWIKTQVKTLPSGKSRYRFKQWQEGNSEPREWDIEGLESGDYPSGALCLVPHNSDVTIHKVSVEPLK